LIHVNAWSGNIIIVPFVFHPLGAPNHETRHPRGPGNPRQRALIGSDGGVRLDGLLHA
jgi:hypothetical protein